MTSNKLIILFALGICLVMFSLLRDYNRDRVAEATVNTECFLTWDGTGLIVSSKKQQEQIVVGKSLPADLRPLFFQPIPLNHADIDLLVTLPGIGPVTAKRILQYRFQQGKITSRAHLLSIKGIGEKTAAMIEQYTTYEL